MPKHQLVKKTKKSKKPELMSFNQVRELENEFKVELETNPKFSLDVDPLRQYDFTNLEVDFINFMVQYKNIKFVARLLLDIDEKEAIEIYKKYEVQEEIKRINLAMYARRFCSKIADLDALGGYLTTALTDENVPIADRLSGKDKLIAVRLLMELNQIKSDMITKPEVIDVVAVEAEIKKLNIKDIEKLIENSEDDDKIIQKKNEIISKIDKDGLLSSEEITYLKTQSIEELNKLLKEIEKGFKNENFENKN